MTKHILFSCLLQEREKDRWNAVRTSLSFGHLRFDIDLTLGFWNLTFQLISKDIFCPF